MRKLARICRKLQRIGICAVVVSHRRGEYVVHYGPSDVVGFVFGSSSRSCSSIRECEEFLQSLFRC